jgi:hypothetical protein
MKCSGTWYRALRVAGAVAIFGILASELRAQGFVGGTPEGSISLGGGDSDGRPASPTVRQPTPTYRPPARTVQPPVRPNYPGPLRKGPPNGGYVGGTRESSPILDRRDLGGGATGGYNPPQRSTWSTQPIPDPFNAQRAINRIDAGIAESLQRRELARQRYQYGGGYARDLNAFRREQARIQALQQARIGVLRSYSANPQALRRAEANARATYGLNAGRYRGALDTRRPIGERATSRWLNNPNYRQ